MTARQISSAENSAGAELKTLGSAYNVNRIDLKRREEGQERLLVGRA
jgi:hypothetical protein